jgi:hypothetical protein
MSALTSSGRPARTAFAAACAAAVLGTLYAAVSAYWALGGTGLLDTVGGVFQRAGQSGGLGVEAVVWLTVALKLLVAGLGVGAVSEHRARDLLWRRRLRATAWIAGVILIVYGGVLSVAGWLVQANVLHAGAHADRRALRWHAFLWDPWFLVWGLLVVFALRHSGRRAGHRRGVITFR